MKEQKFYPGDRVVRISDSNFGVVVGQEYIVSWCTGSDMRVEDNCDMLATVKFNLVSRKEEVVINNYSIY